MAFDVRFEGGELISGQRLMMPANFSLVPPKISSAAMARSAMSRYHLQLSQHVAEGFLGSLLPQGFPRQAQRFERFERPSLYLPRPALRVAS